MGNTKQGQAANRAQHTNHKPQIQYIVVDTPLFDEDKVVPGRITKFQHYVDQRDDNDREEKGTTQHSHNIANTNVVENDLVPHKEDTDSEGALRTHDRDREDNVSTQHSHKRANTSVAYNELVPRKTGQLQ
eukprot:5734676-Heterocapsa_arctica.AAC.2